LPVCRAGLGGRILERGCGEDNGIGTGEKIGGEAPADILCHNILLVFVILLFSFQFCEGSGGYVYFIFFFFSFLPFLFLLFGKYGILNTISLGR